MEQRAFLQLAVLASLATISAFVALGLYRKRQDHHQQLEDVKRLEVTSSAPHTTQQPQKQKVPETSVPTEAAKPPPTNVGEQEATLATKKYKDGVYDGLVELYSV
ncbi:Mitochondrial import receptor subunit TOM70, partial [Phytophthora palmivora]